MPPILHLYHERSLLQGADVLAEIFKLVSYGATPEQWKEWLRVPLEHAAAQGNFRLVQRLLKAGANGGAGWIGCRGRTLLHAAAVGGNEDVVTALLHAGCVPDVSVVSASLRRSALHVALVCGHEAAARRLILAGADVNYRDPTDRCYPLHVAVSGRHKELVRDLLIGGGSPLSLSFGLTPLHLAAKLGHCEIVTTLLGTPFKQTKDRQPGGLFSPLMWACWEGHLPTVKVLLAADVNLTLRTGARCKIPGGSALDLAVIHKHGDVVTALLEHGADVNAAGPTGKTPLHHAVGCKYSAGQHLLLGAGASVHNKTLLGLTPLHVAATSSSVNTMRRLLRRGAHVNETNNEGSTALHLVCAYQRPRIQPAVDLLLRAGASETAVDSAGWTPAAVLERLANRRRCSADEAERARVLLERAPADRAWRRRCWLVMLRARAEEERMAHCLGSNSNDGEILDARGRECAEATPLGRSRDAGEDGGGGSQKAARTDGGGGRVGGEDAMATPREAAAEEVRLRSLVATLLGLEVGGVFRNIVGYL
eukprot:g4060.t1